MIAASMMVVLALASCGGQNPQAATPASGTSSASSASVEASAASEASSSGSAASVGALRNVVPTADIAELEPGLSAVSFEGDDRLSDFLALGGAASDADVVGFLTSGAQSGSGAPMSGRFGCSAISVQSPEGHRLFGRNFDWYGCDALIVSARPTGAHASVSTVNLDFLKQAAPMLSALPSQAQTFAALYAPLDGMNDAGLCAAVLLIEDGVARIEQDSGKPDLTTTTAIRMLLDQAATIDEALDLLERYDMHSSMGLMVHFALSDATGRAVAVEYVNGEMVVTDTDVLTNFYVAEGPKQGMGTAQSHERFEVLERALAETPTMGAIDVRDALASVCKRHYSDGETTEWSMVCDKGAGSITYYHREDYGHGYSFDVGKAGA